MLQRIQVGPKEINFGTIFKETTEVKTFWVKNGLKNHIYIELDTAFTQIEKS